MLLTDEHRILLPQMLSTIEEPSVRFSGFQALSGVFPPALISAAAHGQEAFMEGQWNQEPAFSWPKPKAKTASSWKTPYATSFRSELAQLARSPKLLQSIAKLTGAGNIRYWFDQLLWEEQAPAHRPQSYHWHTERSRWKTCQARLMVTAWVPLTSITSEMGPITFVKNSAKRSWLELPDGWEPAIHDLESATVQPGDAALFCWHTVHGNPPNRASRPRRAIALHYAIDDLNYRPHGRFKHLNERLVRQVNGQADFQDEHVCPLVWAAS